MEPLPCSEEEGAGTEGRQDEIEKIVDVGVDDGRDVEENKDDVEKKGIDKGNEDQKAEYQRRKTVSFPGESSADDTSNKSDIYREEELEAEVSHTSTDDTSETYNGDKLETTKGRTSTGSFKRSNTILRKRHIAKNKFIKLLTDIMLREPKNWVCLEKTLNEKLVRDTSLSSSKVDQAVVELVIAEEEGFKSLIENAINEVFIEEKKNKTNIKDFKGFLNSCLLAFVRGKDALALKEFLLWFFKIRDTNSLLLKMWKGWKNEMTNSVDKKIGIHLNDALIKACKQKDHEKVFIFLSMEFEICDEDFRKDKNLKFNQRHLECFRAKSSSTYQLANFFLKYEQYENENKIDKKNNKDDKQLLSGNENEDYIKLCSRCFDPFAHTLNNIQIAINLNIDRYDLADYAKQVDKIVTCGRRFLVDLLSNCETLEEAKSLLSHNRLLHKYKLQHETHDWDYPRLDEACLSEHKGASTR